METIMQSIPAMISLILGAAFVLMVITNIIVQVLKGATYGKIATNVLALIVALVVTLVAVFAACVIFGIPITWYIVAGAVGLAFAVAYASMFGYDKLQEAAKQITDRE